MPLAGGVSKRPFATTFPKALLVVDRADTPDFMFFWLLLLQEEKYFSGLWKNHSIRFLRLKNVLMSKITFAPVRHQWTSFSLLRNSGVALRHLEDYWGPLWDLVCHLYQFQRSEIIATFKQIIPVTIEIFYLPLLLLRTPPPYPF